MGGMGLGQYRVASSKLAMGVGIPEGHRKAMGLEEGEPVTPVFPNSGYMTGVAGVVGILIALMRAEEGDGWKVSC